MPVQIDDVQAELVAQPKPPAGAAPKAAKPEADLRLTFEKFQLRMKRLRVD